MAIAEPIYIIEHKVAAFEIRAYSPYLVAEVTVSGKREEAINQGFRILANYIFGDNHTSSKIAMTAPVTQTSKSGQKIAMTAPVSQIQSGNKWLVRFAMPANFTMENIPKPNDTRVKLIEMPAQKQAVVRFSGLCGQGDIERETNKLNNFLKSQNLTTNAPITLARYDPPWTLWFMRRNELMVLVD